MKISDLLAILILLMSTSVCHAQFESIPNVATQVANNTRTKRPYRTIVTYNGVVCISTPSYDLMPSGQVIFKHQGMRFDGSGYFWSPAVRDSIVRRNRFGTRIVGTSNQYWPPMVQDSTSGRTTRKNLLTLQPTNNLYFGSGKQTVVRQPTKQMRKRIPTTNNRTQLVRCPNGSYAIICR